ncbi:hypothetical protein WR25_11514 [Diploscapter pachys]|uniref:Uncharacterized protein n=1 Tax=Diploscapter pachys TaxID=2018661 RepID=A0A2A2JK29_9BILA|nr:hypothetical protein WR25_11514 [Diploscapter pachys]
MNEEHNCRSEGVKECGERREEENLSNQTILSPPIDSYCGKPAGQWLPASTQRIVAGHLTIGQQQSNREDIAGLQQATGKLAAVSGRLDGAVRQGQGQRCLQRLFPRLQVQ